MKKMMMRLCVGAIAVCLAACGGNNPKSLAKQSKDVMTQMQNTSDSKKLDELMKKGQAIDAEVKKLSDADKKAFKAELQRLYDDK